LERVCLFERNGTIFFVLFFFGLVLAPVFRPATLIDFGTIAETAPTG